MNKELNQTELEHTKISKFQLQLKTHITTSFLSLEISFF